MSHTPEGKEFTVRCRAIIMHEGKLLVVRHAHNEDFTALPGGHLEWGEGPREAMSREIIEELGVKPVIGRLLFVNTFLDGEHTQPTEFFFEVTNGADYLDCGLLKRTHAAELAEILWASPDEHLNLRPAILTEHLKAGTLLSDEVRFIKG